MLRKTLAAVAVGATVSATLAMTPAEAASPRPRAARTVSVTPTSLKLTWAQVPRARGYRVQISESATMRPARSVDFRRNVGVVDDLEPRHRYFYRVAVVNPTTGVRVSAFTRVMRARRTAAVPTPRGLRAVPRSATSVALSWQAAQGAGAYRVARSTSPAFSTTDHTTTGVRPATTLTGLEPDTTYYFKVQAVSDEGAALTPYSAADTVTTASTSADGPVISGPADVRVGTFNVTTVSGDRTEGNRRPWAQRRAAVVAQILGERLDVVGVQEVNQSTRFKDRLVSGDTQIQDLKNGLVEAGGTYAVTNETPYNCVNPVTSYNCTYQYRGASGGDRIYYNTATLSVVSRGAYAYKTQNPDTPTVTYHLPYAVFRVKSTGDRFLFASTHLDPPNKTVRLAQWHELMDKIDALKGNLPVVVVGDFNMQKMNEPLIAPMLTQMKARGYGDVLNQAYNTNPVVNPRAKRTINAWMNSWNRLDRHIPNWSYHANRAKTGNMIDWIFASNSLPVKEFKVVVNHDPSTLQVTGTMPSDHNLLRATLTLP
jgi:endonuclease/exonuclease/phosphatase family metal-dependent hydrolase